MSTGFDCAHIVRNEIEGERLLFVCLTKEALVEYWKLPGNHPAMCTIDLYNGWCARISAEQSRPDRN